MNHFSLISVSSKNNIEKSFQSCFIFLSEWYLEKWIIHRSKIFIIHVVDYAFLLSEHRFQGKCYKKQLNLFWWYFIYFFHLIKVLVFIFQGVSFIFTLTARRREYYAGHIYLLLLTITFLMLDLSDLLKDCSIAFQIHQTMSYNSTNILMTRFQTES